MYFEQYNLHVHRVMLDTKNYLNFYIDFVSRQTQLDLIKDHGHVRRIYTLIGASKKFTLLSSSGKLANSTLATSVSLHHDT